MAQLQTQTQASRANTLDRMLNDIDLPDLSNGYFSYPVEDFFVDYVDALGQRGLQSSGSLAMSTAPDAGQYESVEFPSDLNNTAQQQNIPLPSAMSLDLPLIPDVPAEQAGPTPFSQAAPYSISNGNAMPHIGNTYQIPTSEAGGHAWADSQDRKAKTRKPKESDYLIDSPGLMDESDEGEKQANGRGGGKAKRNPKQQAQNKQAQQRYRERRKQRFNEMEHAIDGLSAQLEQMQAIQNQNAFLQATRSDLEARLQQREDEIERLKTQLEQGTVAESDPDKSPEQRRKAEDARLQACQASVGAHIQELSKFLTNNGLEQVNPTGEGVDSRVVQRLAELVGQGCTTCQDAMRTEGVKVLRLMSSNVSDFSRIKCIRKKSKMSDILQKLSLTDLQKEQLKLMRQNHLRNLRAVYEARQQLNLQAMSLMLPPSSEHIDLDGKMACMSLSGYGKCARQTADLDEILNSIKENLRLEQKQVMEMNYVTMHRLLSPIQGAFFMVDMHPAFCDALELANALVSQEKAESGENSDDLDKPEQERHSPTSSDNKSDTCALMESHDSRNMQPNLTNHAA